MIRQRRISAAPRRPRNPVNPKMVLEHWGNDGRVVEIGTDGKVRDLHGKERAKAAERWADELRWTSSGLPS